MIRRIRGRQRFERLARDGQRFRRRSLWCTWCPEPDSTHPAVAFAIGRAAGPAVTRNLLRRRLRAILTAIDRHDPLPVGAWLIGARPSASELTFDALAIEMTALIEEVRSRARAGSSA